MTRQELFIKWIKDNNFRSMAEIGVAEGWTAGPVMEACNLDLYIMVEPSLVNCNEVLYDVMKRTDVVDDFGRTLKPAALMRMHSTTAARYIANGSLDIVYIDAEHSYDSVKADIIAWIPKVRLGGILCGHDYDPTGDYDGLIQAVHEMLGGISLTSDSSGGDNNHIWWVIVDSDFLEKVSAAAAVVSNIVTVTEPESEPDVEIPPVIAEPSAEQLDGIEVQEEAQVIVEGALTAGHQVAEGHQVLRIAASKTLSETPHPESDEPPDLEGVPDNLKAYVARLSQRKLDL